MEKPDVNLHHLNLLHLQMDIVLIVFDFFEEKRNKLDLFAILHHVKIAKGFFKLSRFFYSIFKNLSAAYILICD